MNPQSLKSYRSLYNAQRKIVELRIRKVFANRKPRSLYEPSAYLLESGGKRLRPLLVLLSAKAVGGKFSHAYNAAVAVELLHNFTLVHDDIMDNADKRRGRSTLHKKYDVNTAILAGDSLLSVAYEYLLKDCNGNAKNVLSCFTKGLIEVCEGQSLDKEFELRNIKAVNQLAIPLAYKGYELSKDYKIDILVENEIIIELKSVEILHSIFEAQLLTYLKLADKKLGLLINFNVPKLIDGFKRMINGYF